VIKSLARGDKGSGFAGEGTVGEGAGGLSVNSFSTTAAGHFTYVPPVPIYYDTCYTVVAEQFSTTACVHVPTVTKSIKVVRNGATMTITAQVGPGIHILPNTKYRIQLREVDSRGRTLKVLASVRPRDYRQASGFGRVGANLATFTIPALPSGTRLIVLPVSDPKSTAKASQPFVV
jgi:hypothetical protein